MQAIRVITSEIHPQGETRRGVICNEMWEPSGETVPLVNELRDLPANTKCFAIRPCAQSWFIAQASICD